MDSKERFIQIYKDKIKREGALQLLEYLMSPSSDFFTAPASARYHNAKEGGLVEHSLNVYDCLGDYLSRDRVKALYGMDYSDETVAIVSLLHDLCKVNVYKPGFRNVKDEFGTWKRVPTFEFDDKMPYGHGEKSVYIISGYMKLTREEAFAIRYHMGFSGEEDNRNVGKAFELYPLILALATADMEAAYYVERE
ncbi:MAG: hydrolase [Clostridia bacterium]|nr:hydrolase [Clostridia bacterium]